MQYAVADRVEVEDVCVEALEALDWSEQVWGEEGGAARMHWQAVEEGYC